MCDYCAYTDAINFICWVKSTMYWLHTNENNVFIFIIEYSRLALNRFKWDHVVGQLTLRHWTWYMCDVYCDAQNAKHLIIISAVMQSLFLIICRSLWAFNYDAKGLKIIIYRIQNQKKPMIWLGGNFVQYSHWVKYTYEVAYSWVNSDVFRWNLE